MARSTPAAIANRKSAVRAREGATLQVLTLNARPTASLPHAPDVRHAVGKRLVLQLVALQLAGGMQQVLGDRALLGLAIGGLPDARGTNRRS